MTTFLSCVLVPLLVCNKDAFCLILDILHNDYFYFTLVLFVPSVETIKEASTESCNVVNVLEHVYENKMLILYINIK